MTINHHDALKRRTRKSKMGTQTQARIMGTAPTALDTTTTKNPSYSYTGCTENSSSLRRESRTRCVIRIPKLIKLKPSRLSLETSSKDNRPITLLQPQKLFIIIPPTKPNKRKAAKRSFATTLDAREEEEEDDTLIGPLERDLKRPRLLPPSNIQSDDDGDTLIPTPSPLKKSVQRHKISPYPKSTTTLKRHIPISAMEKACSYSGTFDLYAMDHQDLCEIYRPQHSTEPHYEDLYQTLTTRSGYVSEKLTAVVTLPDLPYGRKFGSVNAKAFCDPASERPYDVELTRISHVNQVYYREHERESFAMRYNTDVSMAGKVPGVSGETSVVAQDSTALESRGGFNISRMWYKLDGQGKAKEIFEGYLSLDVRYCKTIRKMGHGDGMNLGFAFWAVRR